MLPRLGFWSRALGVPVSLGLCAYIISAWSLARQTIFFQSLPLFLLFIYIASLVRGSARGLFIALSSVTLAFCVLEAASVAIGAKQLIEQTPGLVVRRPVLGWGPAQPGVYHSKRTDPKTNETIYDVTYKFDDNLLRKTVSTKDGPTIAFFGDSFTLGEGVNDADTMPQAFADLTDRKLRILNFGFSAYSPQQFLRVMETGLFDKVIGPAPRLFVFLTAAWHASRVTCKVDFVPGAPRYVIENGDLVFKGACPEYGKPNDLLSRVAIYRELRKIYNGISKKEDIELYLAEIVKAAALAKARYHVPTIILYMSTPEVYFWPSGFSDQKIVNELENHGLPVIDVSLGEKSYNDPKLSIPGDGHPTPFAHRARAMRLKQFLVEKMPEILALPQE